MKSNVPFDDVGAEKAIAMKKYRRHQNFKSGFKACFVVASVFFIMSRSSTWLPTNAGFSADFFCQLQISNLSVFLLFNALVAAIFALNRQNVNEESEAEAARSPDLYHEFAIHSESYRSTAVRGLSRETEMTPYGGNVVVVNKYPETEMTTEESLCEESFCQDFGETCQRRIISRTETFEYKKKTEYSANAVGPFPPVDDKRTVTETKSSFVPPVRAITGNCTENDYALVEKRYRRTQSEKNVNISERRASQSVYKPKSSKKVMQRSETDIHRKTMSCGGEPARKSSSVEELDDEEFQREVQKFIDRNKETQKKEIEREKKEREGIVMEERSKEEERRKTEEFQEEIDKFINKMKQSHKEECRKEIERKRRTEGNYINRAVL